MTENRKRILEMLSEKKITVDEAERLLAAIGDSEEIEDKSMEKLLDRKLPYKYLRVVVQPDPKGEGGNNAEKVNVRVPLKLIRAGMKLTALLPPQAADKVNEALREKGVEFDWRNIKDEHIEELLEALSDLEVDVQDGKAKVRVYVE